MKTIDQINEEITELIKLCGAVGIKPKKKERYKKQIAQLKQYIKYIEQGVTEEHLARQHKELHETLFKMNDGYEVWKKANPDLIAGCSDVNEMKAKYRKIVGMAKVKKQIKAIKYLLN